MTFKPFIKFGLTSIAIIGYFIITSPFLLTMRIFPLWTKRILNHCVGFFSKLILFIMGIQVQIDGAQNKEDQKNYFVVSNHLSYLDILVISSFLPSCYVTSMEMKAMPLLGQITTLAGCVFVERRNKKNIQGEIKEIEEALVAGLNVVVFPEATSTNGETVIPFKRSLFQAVVNAKVELLPLTIEYKKLNGAEINLKNKDNLFWYGDMDFLPHFFNLCKQEHAQVTLHVNNIIEDAQTLNCSGELRDLSHSIIYQKYHSLVALK